MNNNQNYGQQPNQQQVNQQQYQPQVNQQPNQQQVNQQPNQQQVNQQTYQQQTYQQPYQGQYYQNQQSFYQPNMQWQQPPKKKMSTGCIVALVLGIMLLVGAIVVGAIVVMGAMAFNSVVSEFDDIGAEFYNTAFELYLGEDKPSNSVYKLMASVKANNEDEENIISVDIELRDGSRLNYYSYDSSLIPSDSNYSISAGNSSKGYINSIKIKEK